MEAMTDTDGIIVIIIINNINNNASFYILSFTQIVIQYGTTYLYCTVRLVGPNVLNLLFDKVSHINIIR
jgi:hypothetical protein